MNSEQSLSKKDLEERGINPEELKASSEDNFEEENGKDEETERVKQEIIDLGIRDKVNAGEHLNLKEQLVLAEARSLNIFSEFEEGEAEKAELMNEAAEKADEAEKENQEIIKETREKLNKAYDKKEIETGDAIDENKEIETEKLKALEMKYDTLSEKHKLVLEIEDSSDRGEILEDIIIDCNYVLQNATEHMPEELEKNYKNLRDLVKKDIEIAYDEETEKIVREKIKKGERLDPEEEAMFEKMEKETEEAFEIDKKRK